MKRTAVAWTLLAALGGGCVSTESGVYIGERWNQVGGPGCTALAPPTIPGVQGPWGAPVPVRGPYVANAPSGEAAAKAMIANSMPLDLVQQGGYAPPGPMPPGATVPPPGAICPPGVPCMPSVPGMASGGMPPGPPPGAVAAVGALTGSHPAQFAAPRTSVKFVGPPGLKISWYVPTADGKKAFSSTPLEAPASYNFTQGAIYRLKISDIPDQPGRDLYPTLEVVPANAKTATFLAHSSVPVTFTPDDFRMVVAGNYVVKVIYLPDPQFQDVAGGAEEIISTQLEPGVDPIAEAAKRGNILLVLRLGNIDLELRHSPAMDAPPPGTRQPVPTPAGPAGGRGPAAAVPGLMAPFGLMAPGAPMPPPGSPLVPSAKPGAGLPPLPSVPPAATPPAAGTQQTGVKLPPTPAQMAGQSSK